MAENEVAQNNDSVEQNNVVDNNVAFDSNELQTNGADANQQIKSATESMVESNTLPSLQLTDSAGGAGAGAGGSGSSGKSSLEQSSDANTRGKDQLEGKTESGKNDSNLNYKQEGKSENSEDPNQKKEGEEGEQNPADDMDKAQAGNEKSQYAKPKDGNPKTAEEPNGKPAADYPQAANPKDGDPMTAQEPTKSSSDDTTTETREGDLQRKDGDESPYQGKPGQDGRGPLLPDGAEPGVPGKDGRGPAEDPSSRETDKTPGKDGTGPVNPESEKDADPSKPGDKDKTEEKKDRSQDKSQDKIDKPEDAEKGDPLNKMQQAPHGSDPSSENRKTIEASATLPGLELTGFDNYNANKKATV